MTIRELADSGKYKLVCESDNMDRHIEGVFCCDLLSIAMSKAPEGSAWVTVMANLNTLAVAQLTDVACIILAHGLSADEVMINKAKMQGIPVFETEDAIFETADFINRKIR